jgi:PAS domain S-box-containing protein
MPKNGSNMDLPNSLSSLKTVLNAAKKIFSKESKEKCIHIEKYILDYLLKNIEEDFYVKDKYGNIIYSNCPRLDYNIDGNLQRTVNLQFNKYSIKIAADDREVLKQGKPFIRKEITSMASNGKIESFSTSKIPITDESGNVLGIISINRNITQQKQHIEELQTFLNIAKGLYSADSFYEIGKTVFDNLEKFRYTNFPGGKLSVYDSDKDIFKAAYIRENSINLAPVETECKLEDVKYYTKVAIEKQGTLYIEDTHSEYSLNIDPRQRKMPSGVMLFIPLYHKGSLVGVFSFARFPKKSLDDEFVNFLESIAKYISISVGELLNEGKRKEVENALREEHNLLRTLIDNMPDDIYIKDTESRLIIVNKTLLDHLKSSSDQILGKTDFDLMDIEEAKSHFNDEKMILETGRLDYSKEVVFIDGVGKTRSITIKKVPLKTEEGKTIGLIGLSRDNTDYLRTLEELEILSNISQGLHLAKSFEDIGKCIFEHKNEYRFISNSGGKLSVYHESDDVYELVYESSIHKFRIPIPKKCTLAEVGYYSRIAIVQKSTLFIANNHSEYSLNIDSRQIYSPEHSLVFMPLFYKEKLVGLFSFARVPKNSIDERFVKFLEGIARLVSIAVGELLIEEQRRKAEDKLKASNEQLKEYSRVFIELQEEERKRISRELHDGVNQILVSAKLKIDDLRNKPIEVIQGECSSIKAMLDRSVKEIRNISHNLHPIILDDLGLIDAINNYKEDFKDRTGIDISVEFQDFPDRLPYEHEINIYRIIQESLNNIEKHADATAVKLILEYLDPNIYILIKDNGKGMDSLSLSSSTNKGKMFGLRNIKERVGILDGEIIINSTPTEGTTILIKFPYNKINKSANPSG